MNTAFETAFYKVVGRAIQHGTGTAVDDHVDLSVHGFDSLAMMRLILELEEELDCYLPPEDLAHNVTLMVVGDLKAAMSTYVETR